MSQSREDGRIRRALLAPNPRHPYDIGPEPTRSAQNPPKFREHSPSQPVIPGEERAIEGQPVSKTLWVSGDRPVALVPSGWRFYSERRSPGGHGADGERPQYLPSSGYTSIALVGTREQRGSSGSERPATGGLFLYPLVFAPPRLSRQEIVAPSSRPPAYRQTRRWCARARGGKPSWAS